MNTLFNPFWFLRDYLKDLGVEECCLCVYRYDRRFKEMERRFVWSSLDSLEITAVGLGQNLSLGEELAICSRCRTNNEGEDRHLAMLDWRGDTIELFSQIGSLANNIDASDFLLAWSGRSFHVYFKKLLSHQEMQRFLMESILLEDSANGTDYRWIAHRLLDGFATLRLTNSSNRHLYEPQVLVKGLGLTSQTPNIRNLAKQIRVYAPKPYTFEEPGIEHNQPEFSQADPTLWDTCGKQE